MKHYINSALTWKHYKSEDGDSESYHVKNGETTVFSVHVDDIRNGKINSVVINDPSPVTKEGLHVGSTSGDLLDAFPNASINPMMVPEFRMWVDVGYVEVNGI